MAEITFAVDVHCQECGEELTATYNAVRERIDVSPCGACLKKADGEGYNRGVDDSAED